MRALIKEQKCSVIRRVFKYLKVESKTYARVRNRFERLLALSKHIKTH